MTVLRMDRVSKTYADGEGARTYALIDASLEVRQGEMVALVGPSGSGKTTLLNLAGCIDLPTEGTVVVADRTTSQLGDRALTALRREHVGTVFQAFNLLPALTVEENVALPLVLQRRSAREVRERVREVLELVGLEPKARSFPGSISGGEAQRVAIARAVVHRPAIVLADEPTGNLDSENGARAMALLRSLASAGQTILLATHSERAIAVCDRTIWMHDGRIADSA